jgi:hypothetical protein
MRLRIEYFTGSLQKKSDRLVLPDTSTTDLLI